MGCIICVYLLQIFFIHAILAHYNLIRTNKITEMALFMHISNASDDDANERGSSEDALTIQLANANTDGQVQDLPAHVQGIPNLVNLRNDRIDTIEMPKMGSLAAEDGLGNASTHF